MYERYVQATNIRYIWGGGLAAVRQLVRLSVPPYDYFRDFLPKITLQPPKVHLLAKRTNVSAYAFVFNVWFR